MTGDAPAVDAHVHLWDLARVALSWFRPDLGLPEVAGIDDLADTAATVQTPIGPVGAAIAVQAADTLAEARWLTGLRHRLLAGAVLQYDPADTLGAAAALTGRHVRGVRVAVPARRADLSDVAGLDALCDRAAAADRVVEFLVRPEQLPAVGALAGRHPGTAVVICHLGLGAGDPSPAWEAGLREVAAHQNAAAKVSGVITDDGGADEAADARLRHVLAVAVDAFGPDRLLFGSDWPMSARVAPYERVVALTAAALPPLGAAGDAALWGGTARRLYRL